jgi:hypothetical protein
VIVDDAADGHHTNGASVQWSPTALDAPANRVRIQPDSISTRVSNRE